MYFLDSLDHVLKMLRFADKLAVENAIKVKCSKCKRVRKRSCTGFDDKEGCVTHFELEDGC